MNIIAFDLSLTHTGWADSSGYGVFVPPKTHDRGIPRLRWIRAQILESVKNPTAAAGVDLVVLEGYSFASRHASHQLGELGGVIRIALSDRDIPYVDVQPSCRAMFATGKGNAGKEEVLAEAIRKLGYQGHSNDEADALWLLRMARAHYAGNATNDKQRAALSKIEWPVLSAKAAA